MSLQPSRFIYLCLHFLVLYFQLKPDGSKQECVFIEEFLENNYTALVSAKYTGWYLGFNRKGRPKKGSRTTQRQQEVHFMKRQPKGRVDPLEEFRFTTVTKRTRRARSGIGRRGDGPERALLVVETETFGSHIRIKGKESGHYICMNEKGKIVGRPDGSKQECVFIEEFLENNYTALVSAKYTGWYLGFNRKGRPKKGSRTTQRQQEVHFMKRQPKGRVDPLEEFRFTTVTKRTRRARRLKTSSKRN
ncbi:unnamed protein product [Menidia menidia]|uniref:Fibroblast growth factor n=1 Tax=Menidia menidia TaxID=238744 RepID=A0A8S4BM91_9TELE|nr:unnamed protein product [Menidia menidia]